MGEEKNSDLVIAQGTIAPVPGKPTDGGHDVISPTVKVLKALNLLSDEKSSGFADAFTGPPSSVAILEAGATAAAKWWSAAGAVAFAGTWAVVRAFWDGNPPETQRTMLVSAAIFSAAIVLAIGYLLASDVRGRAAAMVATIEARAQVARAIAEVAIADCSGAPGAASKLGPDASELADGERQVVHLTGKVRYLTAPQEDELDWTALAMSAKLDGSDIRFYISKNGKYQWVSPAEVKFDGTTSHIPVRH